MTDTREDETAARFLAEVRERTHLVDLLVLGLVPAVLLAVFWLEPATREGLVFVRANPSLTTAFTAHYVHLERPHLLGNLAVYVLTAPTVYLLLLLSDRRAEFLMVTTTVLLGFPLVLTGLDTLVIDHGRLFGFSGLAMAFVGALPVALFLFLDERIEPAVGLDDAPLLFFVGIAIIAVRTVTGPVGWLLAAGTSLLALVYVGRLVRALPRPLTPELRASLRRSGYVELAVAAPVLFALAVWTAFPAEPASAGRVVDLLGHFLGYSVGFLAAFLAIRVDRALGAGRDVPPPPPEPPIHAGEPPDEPPDEGGSTDA